MSYTPPEPTPVVTPTCIPYRVTSSQDVDGNVEYNYECMTSTPVPDLPATGQAFDASPLIIIGFTLLVFGTLFVAVRKRKQVR